MKTPDECANMEDIRAEIDRINQDIIALMGKRFKYVKAAAKFKTSRESVKAPERFTAMLRQRRDWAEQAGLSPDVIEKLYSDLVEYFINEEMTKWKAEKN
ncbi:MAG: isochorismate lyase [Candidatus Poribacteria bacterium]|nr:isochorismate lyase [Candidatus Poribacteria bacterium]